jgi:hypothetical protein
LTLAANTYGRKADGCIWQGHMNMLLVGPPIHTKRLSTEADMWCNLKSTTELLPGSVEKGIPKRGAFASPNGCTSICEVHASKSGKREAKTEDQTELLRLAQSAQVLTQHQPKT